MSAAAHDEFSDPRLWTWGVPMLLVGFGWARSGTRVHAWAMSKSSPKWVSEREESVCVMPLCWVGGPPHAVDEFLADFSPMPELTCAICRRRVEDFDEGGRRLPDEVFQ